MLVKLYDLDNDWTFLAEQEAIGVTIRKAIGPEKHLILDWVGSTFSDAWSSEADVAISNSPTTCFVAIHDTDLIGFSCYDATTLGFFGPIGVAEVHRKRNTGTCLLKACMLDMKLKGYGYAIIPTTQFEFYQKGVGATVIPDSSPGVYKGMLRR